MTFRRLGFLCSKALAVFLALAAVQQVSFAISTYDMVTAGKMGLYALVLNVGTAAVMAAALLFVAAAFWMKATSFAPSDTPAVPSPTDLRTLEGLVYRSIGIWVVLSSAPLVIEAVISRISAGGASGLIPIFLAR